MLFPESWLREFCNPPLASEQLAELLTMSGMEVESLEPVAPPITKVVVAQVLAVERHPNADRLNVCTVDVGSGTPLTIVCGAPNVRAGMKVPCALVGARLPPADEGGAAFEIKRGELRGVESDGMLCSARELKLSEDHSGLLELPADARLGRDVREQLQLDDMLFTLKLTPNLAHGLSVYGVAREVAALTGAPLETPAVPAVAVKHGDTLPVAVDAPDLCGRFSGRIIRNVDPRAATPAWMVERLRRCGQRSVTALVDISNYVMFESGQPSHIFDLDRIHGGLRVRWGAPASRSNCSMAIRSRSTPRSASSPTTRPSNRSPASWAVQRPRYRMRRATSTSKQRSGGPKRSPGVRGASTSRPTPGIASSAASIRRRPSSASSASRNS